MHKNMLFWALVGWFVSLVFPPAMLLGLVKGVFGRAS